MTTWINAFPPLLGGAGLQLLELQLPSVEQFPAAPGPIVRSGRASSGRSSPRQRRRAVHPAICRLRRRLGRRDKHLRKTIRDSAQLAASDRSGPPGHWPGAPSRRPPLPAPGSQRQSPLLPIGPAPSPLHPADHLNPRHRTVTCTAASTVTCTYAATQPANPATAQGGLYRTATIVAAIHALIAEVRVRRRPASMRGS